MSSEIGKYLMSAHGISILLAKYKRAKLKAKILNWELIHANSRFDISEKRRIAIENSIATANQNPYIKVLEDEIAHHELNKIKSDAAHEAKVTSLTNEIDALRGEMKRIISLPGVSELLYSEDAEQN